MHEPYLKAMAALLRRSQPRHDLYTVFGHCMEAMALAMANSVDLRQRDPREARYLDIVGRYRPDVLNLFPQSSPNWCRLSKSVQATCWAPCFTTSSFTTRRGDNSSRPIRSVVSWLV
jgi:hypothetical protein